MATTVAIAKGADAPPRGSRERCAPNRSLRGHAMRAPH